MGKNKVQIVIICEDRQQEVFARYFLAKRGFKIGHYRVVINPKEKGSGEQFVREKYPSEVQGYRQNRNRVTIGLVVMIDADNLSVQQRLNQLDLVLQEKRLLNRQRKEAIAVFIPKRNIETWIDYLKGKEVNKEYKKTYNKLAKESGCKSYVEALAESCQSQERLEDAPDSLNIACQEFQRLLPLLN